MNGFETACRVEENARRILEPFLEERSDNGRFVYTNKGLLARFLQETCGDVFLNKSGRLETIELKAEEKWTNNLFLETFSNRNLEDAASYAMRGINTGWMSKLRADWLLYYFLSNDTLCIMKMLALQQWAFGSERTHKLADEARKQTGQDWAIGLSPGRIYDFPEKPQRRYEQCNDTWGRCVPVSILEEELNPPLKRVRVAQLSFRFNGNGT